MSDKDSKFNLLAIGVIGAAVGYIVGKNFGSKISSEVKRVAENPEDIKENIEKIRENGEEIIEDVRDKVTDILGQLDSKLKAVDAFIGKENGKKGSKGDK